MHLNINNRTIFCKDNLEILQGINSDSIDLIYLDPPFNKKKVFTASMGSSASGASFKDIFKQEDIKDEWAQTIKEDRYKIHELLHAVKNIEGRSSYNYCYLAYMAIRLIECQRILKETGSIYIHCDPTMSHYLKLLLDCILGEENYRNEIIWSYRTGGVSRNYFPRKHDVLFFYVKSKHYRHNPIQETILYESPFFIDPSAKVNETGLYPVQVYVRDVWEEGVKPIINTSKERTGYPTQKPLALIERIIKASSNEGDMVLDPFCGCATTCVAAERLNRQWVGVDISIKAYDLVRERLEKEIEGRDTLFYENLITFSTDPPARTDREEAQERKYVYVISHRKFPGEYKVGIAANVKARLNSYQIGDPEREYKLEHSLHTPYYRETEAYIHTKYENKHEWVRGTLKNIIRDIEQYRIDN